MPDAVLERDPEIRAAHPLLVRTLSLIAHEEIRARGTLCGSLAHADPAAELPALLLATDGEVEVDGPAGPRRVPAAEFFDGPFTAALDDGEMVVAARLPVPGPASGLGGGRDRPPSGGLRPRRRGLPRSSSTVPGGAPGWPSPCSAWRAHRSGPAARRRS